MDASLFIETPKGYFGNDVASCGSGTTNHRQASCRLQVDP
jgi:hypothetical protein